MGPLGGSPHMMGHGMGPGPHGMMSNGMLQSGMMSSGHIGSPGQMPQNMGGSPHMMGGPNMNVNQNGPMMGGLNRPHMGHGGPVMSSHPGISSINTAAMPHMGHMPTQQQMNCLPHVGNSTFSDEPPEKKKKTKVVQFVLVTSLIFFIVLCHF